MKKIKNEVSFIMLCVAVAQLFGLLVYCFIFHWNNPHYTEMMLFQKFWLHYLVSIAILIGVNEAHEKITKE